MTDTSNNHADLNLPGYQLREMLGAGGYGEVWLADAPGGLTKAVKIIFGYHNEKRAARELRSLEKIKSVRHPFLLSLERIEVIDGRLVVVTELADASLKDRFDHFRQAENQPGIPREELLGYLRDSADALDYLSEHHSLQHLDIKPENLLLVAGHVKVADFGLVKEIQDTQASLVGGMTPLYSAPEVFQGQPTSFSDQYSLAVLYQEMLTGALPFSGTSSAELTLQHMHDEPELSPLPTKDRFVVARALSKDPKQRFSSCCEFVQALQQIDQQKSTSSSDWNSRPVAGFKSTEFKPQTTSAQELRKSRPGTMTQVFEDDLIENGNQVSDSMLMDLPNQIQAILQGISPLDLHEGETPSVPTLVIGIGGTAGHVLRQFRQRLTGCYGVGASVPAIQLLQLDTDKKALLETSHSEGEAGLAAEETLSLQLRRPQDYREHAARISQWLSRRWLYNIPKSLKPEGLRPLGRLAFADHARRVVQRIRLALSQAMDAESREQSQRTTGRNFDGQKVRVYVVASISGGTGSGMSLDIGYAVKGLLEKMGIQDATTTGLILHSTGRDSRYCDLAKVNAYSWLTEFNHFSRPEGFYPGDQSSGLPAMSAGTAAFDNTYFLNLGDGLSSEQLQDRTESVAHYLLLDSLSEAQTFFSACRETNLEVLEGQPVLRTFGLHEQAVISKSKLATITHQLCQRVVLRWSGSELEQAQPGLSSDSIVIGDQETSAISDTSHIISGAPRAVASLQLNLEGISANAREFLEGQFGSDPEDMLTGMLKELEAQQALNPRALLQQIDTSFSGNDSNGSQFICGRRLDSVVSPLGMKLASDLQRWLLSRLDDRQERLAGTREAAQWFAEHFKRVETDAQRLSRAIGDKLVAIVNEFAGNKEDAGKAVAALDFDQLHQLSIRYFRLRLDLSALHATRHLVRMLHAELKSLGEAIVEFGRHLRHLADKVVTEPGNSQEGNSSAQVSSGDSITRSLLSNMPALTEAVDLRLQEQYIETQGGLFQTVMGNRKVIVELLSVLQSVAAEEVEQASRLLTQSSSANYEADTLQEYAAKAKPALGELGGVASQLAILPQKEAAQQVAECVRDALGNESSVLTGAVSSFVLCTEIAGLPLSRVAIDLIECRRDYAEFAGRVHTRCDVSWSQIASADSNLEEISQPAAPVDAEMGMSVCATQVLNT